MSSFKRSDRALLSSQTEKSLVKLGQSIQEASTHVGLALSLTPREIQCAYCILLGYSSKEIACVMSVSDNTAKTHIRNLKSKLNCYSRSQVVNLLLKSEGLLDAILLHMSEEPSELT